MQSQKESEESRKRFKDALDKFERAKSDYSVNIKAFDERELIYLGTRDFDPNINVRNTQAVKKKANNVRNVVYEFVESQIDTQIPQPSVRSKREAFKDHAKVIENSISNDLLQVGIERLNDQTERTTPINGFSVFEVIWDSDFKHHLYRGEIKVKTRHPKQLIPQPGVWELQEMEFFFIVSSVTKQYIKRRYDKDVETEEEQFPELNTLSGQSYNTSDSNLVNEIVMWYKDEDGDISKLVWCNNTILEDLPKFYYRRLERCTKCNSVKGVEDACACGNSKFKTVMEEYETLVEDVVLSNGEVIPSGEEIPYFNPTKYPIIVRINVPSTFNFGGQSDVDVIRDQQDAIKRVVTKLEEKVLKGGSIVKVPENLKNKANFENNNSELKLIYGTPAELASVGVESLQPDITKDMVFIQDQYKSAQSTLGITDSFQGKPDPTATSGVAKQLQIAQATGRIQSKMFNKYAAYKELFEIMFEFKLAFYDELRPYVAKDQNGNELFGDFNKYDFLVKDKAGKWYWNTDFLFTADAGSGLPNDKVFIYNQAKELFATKAIDQIQLWSILESLRFPMASDIKKQLEERQKQQAQPQGQNAQVNPNDLLNGLAPDELDILNQHPELMQQAMSGNNE